MQTSVNRISEKFLIKIQTPVFPLTNTQHSYERIQYSPSNIIEIQLIFPNKLE